jgi:hypothetical protein
MDPVVRKLALIASLACAPAAHAQDVYRFDEYLAPERPEAWAMRWFSSATTMTSFGATPALASGDVRVALELGALPRLDEEQRRVGFSGDKVEDLNKSPAFGRVRGWIGLPAGLVAELGYTPPVAINGAKTRDLVAAAVSRRLLERNGFVLSGRVLGQHGAVTGNITCPRELAGDADSARNPYGCEAPSRDRMRLNHYGIEATAAYEAAGWQWHATAGRLRLEPEVQVDALTYGLRDLSRLVSHGYQSYVALGGGRQGPRWGVRAELLYVPLRVKRAADRPVGTDPLLTLRIQVSRAFGQR